MLVALLLVSMISFVMIEALRFGQRTYLQITSVDADNWEVFAAQRFMRRILESAYPFQSESNVDSFSMEGGPERIVVSAPSALAFGSGGYQRYELYVARAEPDSRRRNLMIAWSVDRNGRRHSDMQTMHKEVLIENIAQVQWGYATLEATENKAGAPKWNDTWEHTPGLPTMVRMRVVFPEGDARLWPDLIVATKITHDANCLFDSVSQDCRGSM